MKQWRPPIWASEKVKKKKEHLRDERRRALGIEPVEPPPPVIVQALQERITSDPLELPLGDLNSTPGVVTPSNLLACIDKQPALPHTSSVGGTAPQHQGQIVLNLKGTVLPRGAPALDRRHLVGSLRRSRNGHPHRGSQRV